VVVRYVSQFSKRRYTLYQHVVLRCLKVQKNATDRISPSASHSSH